MLTTENRRAADFVSDEGPGSTRRAGTLQGIILILPITLATMGVVVLAPILPQMAAHFAGRPASGLMVQLILAAPALCLAIFATPVGWLADRVGRRRLLIASMALYSLAGVAPVFLDGLWAILASRLAVGLTEAVIMVCSTTLIGDYFTGAARDKWLAYQTGIASLSALVLLAASGMLASVYGWRGPFWIYASSVLLMVGILAFTWEPRAATPGAHASEIAPPTDFPLRTEFPLRKILAISALTVLGSMGFFIAQIELAGALTEKGLTDVARIGTLSGAVTLAVPVGSVLFRYVVSRWSLRAQLTTCFLLMGAGLLMAGLAGSIAVLLTGVVIDLLGGGLVLPTLLTWIMRQLNFEQRGRGTGIWMAAFEIGQFASALAAAGIAALLGGLHTAFTVVGAACGAVGVMTVVLIAIQAKTPATASM